MKFVRDDKLTITHPSNKFRTVNFAKIEFCKSALHGFLESFYLLSVGSQRNMFAMNQSKTSKTRQKCFSFSKQNSTLPLISHTVSYQN